MRASRFHAPQFIVDTLHPIHEGRVFRWRADSVEQPPVVEYGPSNVGEAAASWQSSPFYHLVATGANELRASGLLSPSR